MPLHKKTPKYVELHVLSRLFIYKYLECVAKPYSKQKLGEYICAYVH